MHPAAARRPFICHLCEKSYSRHVDLDAHERSYDHLHRQRRKDMIEMSKDPNAVAKARAREKRETEKVMRSIPLPKTDESAPKKKPVFIRVGEPRAAAEPQDAAASVAGIDEDDDDDSAAVHNGWANDRYDPMFPTGCGDDCPVCRGGGEALRLG